MITRLDLVQKRFDNTPIEKINKSQAYLDMKILFDEIHERDILLTDLREQIAGLEKRIAELKQDKKKTGFVNAVESLDIISECEYENGIGTKYESEQWLDRFLKTKIK